MWRQILRVKVALVLLAAAGFAGGLHAATYPGPTGLRPSGAVYLGPDYTFPLRSASLGFFLFAAACAVGAAWVQVAETKAGPARPRTANQQSPDYELVD